MLVTGVLSVPPSVRLPLAVTVPVSVKPATVPVPPTLVTVPTVELVPAPIAVRNVAASNVLTLLSALTRKNVTAPGLASVNKLPPTVVAPKLVRPVAAVKPEAPPSQRLRSLNAVSQFVCEAVVGIA